MKTKKRQNFQKCLCSFLPHWIGKKIFLQWHDHFHLYPVDVSYDELKVYNDGQDFNPSILDHKELRKSITPLSYKYMKRAAEISNHNIVRNSDAYMSSGGQIDPDNEFS